MAGMMFLFRVFYPSSPLLTSLFSRFLFLRKWAVVPDLVEELTKNCPITVEQRWALGGCNNKKGRAARSAALPGMCWC